MSSKKIILTLISEKELPVLPAPLPWLKRIFGVPEQSQFEYLRHFDAVNVKFGAYDRGFGLVLDAHNCERHAWEFLEMNTVAQAEALAKVMASKCAKHKIKAFNANAEAGWSGTDPYPKYPNPYEVMQRFIETFKTVAPAYTELWYNGWSWSTTRDGRRLHDLNSMKNFQAWSPMIYGTSPHIVEVNWKPRCFAYQTRLPDQKIIPMIGVGRVDDKGQVWGDWEMHKHLLTTTKVDGVNFYFGNGAKSQMLVGNVHHPALVACVQDLRSTTKWED